MDIAHTIRVTRKGLVINDEPLGILLADRPIEVVRDVATGVSTVKVVLLADDVQVDDELRTVELRAWGRGEAHAVLILGPETGDQS